MQRRAYIDPDTYEISLMAWAAMDDLWAGWIPHVRTMERWRAGTLRLYQTTDTNRFITMPGRTVWEIMTEDESYDIRAQIQHPWIPDGSAIELYDADIDALEALMNVAAGEDDDPPPAPPGGGAVAAAGAESQHQPPQSAAAALVAALAWGLPENPVPGGAAAAAAAAAGAGAVHTHYHTHVHPRDDALWALMRPALLWETADPWTVAPVAPRQRPIDIGRVAALMAGSQGSDLLTLALAASMAPTAPQSQAQAQAAPAPAPFPKHLADMVLKKAEADAATCPITMEPIKAADAAVTSCGHVFQTGAIREWLATHATCPECRQSCSV